MDEITVIIPTMAESSRKISILNAIDSVFNSSKKSVSIIVVANGYRKSEDVIQTLERIRNVTVVNLSEPSIPLACLKGRSLVNTPYFSFLDDDDEYIDLSLDDRLEILNSDESIDFLVTNGYRHTNGVDELIFDKMESITIDPLISLLYKNWMASCGSLFRTNRIGLEYFENYHKGVEWTWLAFRLVMDEKKIGILDIPTYRIHDTDGSASKSNDYIISMLDLYKKMLSSSPPKNIQKLIKYKIGNWYHDRADFLRLNNQKWTAWIYHLNSLSYPGGIRFLPFTRYLLF